MSKSLAVLDSGVAILRVLNSPASSGATALWNRLLNQQTILYVPRLWYYEVVSALRKYVYDSILTIAEAEDALNVIFDLGVTLVEEDKALCLAALRWASRLKQRAAYDACYLALAEQLNAPFWTADQRLFNNARESGVNWVHFIAEA